MKRSRSSVPGTRSGAWLPAAAAVAVVALGFLLWNGIRHYGGRIVGDFFYPYLRLMRSGADAAADAPLLAAPRVRLVARLQALEERNRQLSAQSATAGVLAEENARLRKLLKLAPGPDWSYVPAEIILRDPWFRDEILTVDRGARDGVEPGSAAIAVTAEGDPVLLGVVDRVTGNTATVITLFHPEMRMAVRLPLAAQTGVLNAAGRRLPGGGIGLGQLPVAGRYTVSEAVTTTGFESGVPGGLKLGNLARFEAVDSVFSSSPHLDAVMTPAIAPAEVRFLMLARPNRRSTP